MCEIQSELNPIKQNGMSLEKGTFFVKKRTFLHFTVE